MTEILTVRCKDCGEMFMGTMVQYIDAEIGKDIEKYRKQGHIISVVSKGEAIIGNCVCEDTNTTEKEIEPTLF